MHRGMRMAEDLRRERGYSTGLAELDALLGGLIPGDNIVWQVDQLADYEAFARPFAAGAVAVGHRTLYLRFADHAPVLADDAGVERVELDPQAGFEMFLGAIHATIGRAGRGACYLFDSLSDLAVDWFSDQMLGNFFRLTCPYLYDMGTIAYFALLRDYHSLHATAPIRETTQLFLDAYRHKGELYVRPRKVQQRHTPGMHLLHAWRGGRFVSVTDSHQAAEIMTASPRSTLDTAMDRLDVWNRAFLQAEEALRDQDRLGAADHDLDELHGRLLRMVISRDERMLRLARRHLSLEEVLQIGRRTVGTGLIGGKSVGMLLARAILQRADPRWRDRLEVHDSFYIASDVFYSFLVRNGCWWIRQNQRNPATFLQGVHIARRRILEGTFPEEVERQFAEILDYFGPSPIIVRSSSLLEDNFGNAFAGKYESVFCPNQGTLEQRLENFLAAVRTIYASTMREEALNYRARHGILGRDEQMALLVQRVSGSLHDGYFYPQLAGVAYSFNPYAWSDQIDPRAGLVRLVFGLGTRAVDRTDDDYTRIIALNSPERRPERSEEGVGRLAQQKVDALDLTSNALVTTDFSRILAQRPAIPMHLFASYDPDRGRYYRERGRSDGDPRALTFDRLIAETSFIDDMREMLKTLQEAYAYPVDVEFTANFLDEREYKINIVQCRPLQVKGGMVAMALPDDVAPEQTLLRTRGPVIGHSRVTPVDRVILVVPAAYGNLPAAERYAVARLIGRLNAVNDKETTLLIGPGRWGTTTPALGITVSFAEIDRARVVCEIVAMREDLVPDVSLGTHFFSELVEMEMLWLALFPTQSGNLFNQALLEAAPNRLTDLVPDAAHLAHVVRVVDAEDLAGRGQLRLHADTLNQRVLCYLARGG